MSNPQTIRSIQALRGIAACMVVIFHAVNRLQEKGLLPEIPLFIQTGRAGVDIFFVISGFIMVWIGGNKFQIPGATRDFLVRRVIRVVPIYWVYTLVMVTLMALFPSMVSHGKTVDAPQLMTSLLFIPWLNSVGDLRPVLSVGWTLNHEMYFYIVFGTLLLFRKELFLPLLTTIFLSGILLGMMIDHPPVVMGVVTSTLLAEFLMGCAIGVCYKRHTSTPPVGILLATLIGGIAALVVSGIVPMPGLPREIKLGVPGAMIVGSAVFLEKARVLKVGSLLTSVGDSSYSLYLTNIFTVALFAEVWVRLTGAYSGTSAGIWSFVILAVMGAIVAAHAAYLLLEKPVTSWLNRMYRNVSQRPSPSVENRHGQSSAL